MKASTVLVGHALALLALLATSPASGFCRLPKEFSWEGHSEIPVFLREDTRQWLLHVDFIPWTQQELELEIEYAIEAINDTSSAAHPRLVYRGLTEDSRRRNAIVIVPTPLEPEDGCGTSSMNNQPPSKGQQIRLGISTFPCNQRWEHWSTDPGARVMRSVLLHELGHALGLAHPDGGSAGGGCAGAPGGPIIDCDPFCGVMGINTGISWEGEAFYLDDVLGLQAVYSGGFPQAPQDHEESTGGLTWFTAPSLPSGPPVRSTFGGASSSGDDRLVFASRAPLGLAPQLNLWDFPSGSWSAWWRGPVAWRQLGKVGASIRPKPLEAYGFFELNQGEFLIEDPQKNPRKIHLWTRHTIPGPPDRFFMHQADPTTRHGIDGTYDPVTGDRFATWRGVDNRIRIAWINGETDLVRRTFLLDQYAYENPEIVCSDTTSTPFRCLIVYPTAAEQGSREHVHITRWWQFSPRTEPIINGVRYILDGADRVRQNGYLQFGPVSVAYEATRDEFLFAWKNPGRCWYTALKDAAPEANWHDERSHCRSGGSGAPPTLGTTRRTFQGIDNHRP